VNAEQEPVYPYGLTELHIHRGLVPPERHELIVYTWLGLAIFQYKKEFKPNPLLCVGVADGEQYDFVVSRTARTNPEAEQAARWLLDLATAFRG